MKQGGFHFELCQTDIDHFGLTSNHLNQNTTTLDHSNPITYHTGHYSNIY